MLISVRLQLDSRDKVYSNSKKNEGKNIRTIRVSHLLNIKVKVTQDRSLLLSLDKACDDLVHVTIVSIVILVRCCYLIK